MPAASKDEALRAISIDEIAQRLGGRWVLRGISLRVDPGECVAVVGHNGSGKTTLLRVLSTVLRPTRGTGRIFGHDLVQDADGVRAECAMLSHGGGLYGDLTAAENLAFAQRMMGERADMQAIRHALDRVGIGGFANTRVRTFSSGMQRRTAVARLYLRDARLLLLDEPYNSLDGDGVSLVDELLASVRSKGGAAVVVLHDLERTNTEFDRVIELAQGRIVTGAARSTIHAA
ncbi:MAG TPA: heme ABC exporter ATP-binding protein CcmA [Gemmatimonadaceae bacterium]|nr:heme ABC exporter ATP-binding protein CcmA [Gemmatimonadaceae bacterium]